MNLSIEYFRPIRSNLSGEPGTLVMVRPCPERYHNKTYIGILVGDATIDFINVGTKEEPKYEAYRNPMILIPETKSVVFGAESWWGPIEKEEDLRQITDADIQDIWYVKALKQTLEREKRAQ